MTAVFAAGLSARARSRLAAASSPPDTAYAGIRIPFSFLTPPGGHGTTVTGAAMLTLGSAARSGPAITAAPAVHLELDVADSDGWLIGGPGTTPVGGALPLELRRVQLLVDVGLHGGASGARLVLGEGAALGAEWAQLVVAAAGRCVGVDRAAADAARGAGADQRADRQARRRSPASPAGLVSALLKAAGLGRRRRVPSCPDALDHLLHDPGRPAGRRAAGGADDRAGRA